MNQMFSRKGQGIGQVFLFIIAGLSFALILIFGYKVVSDFLSRGEEVQFYQFKTNLETSIKKIYTEYGSVRIETFRPPGSYSRICFVDLDDTRSDMAGLCRNDSLACDVWREARLPGGGYNSVDENVFLTPIAPVKIKVHDIALERGYLCLPILDGQFRLRLQGLGDRTQLSSPK